MKFLYHEVHFTCSNFPFNNLKEKPFIKKFLNLNNDLYFSQDENLMSSLILLFFVFFFFNHTLFQCKSQSKIKGKHKITRVSTFVIPTAIFLCKLLKRYGKNFFLSFLFLWLFHEQRRGFLTLCCPGLYLKSILFRPGKSLTNKNSE